MDTAPEPRPASSRREIALASALLTAFVVAQLALTKGSLLLTKHFWVDEWYTYLVVSEPDSGRFAAAFTEGAETNSPLLHMALRAWCALTGGAGEFSLRAFSLASVLCGLTGLYAVLRTRWTAVVAAAGVLAVWTHPVLQRLAFDARYYGPMFAAAVWYAHHLAAQTVRPSAARAAAVAACAAALCGIHYFGILSWCAATAGVLALCRREPGLRATLRALRPALAGPLVTLVAVPLALVQSRTHSVPTWAEGASVEGLVLFLQDLLFPRPFAIVGILAGGIVAFCGVRGGESAPRATAAAGGVAALALVVPVLAVATVAGFPCAVPRYGVSATAAFGVAAAALVAILPKRAACCAIVVFAVYSTLGLHLEGALSARNDAADAALIDRARVAVASGRPVVAESHHQWALLRRYAPDVAAQVRVLDFTAEDLTDDERRRARVRLFDRDQSRCIRAVWGFPEMAGLDALPAGTSWWLLRYSADGALAWRRLEMLSEDGRLASVRTRE